MRDLRLILLPLLVLLLTAPLVADTLDDALKAAGFQRDDLGWKPQGWWLRFPRDIPHKLNHFDDLFADPTAIVPFTRVLGRSVEKRLGPEGLAAKPERGAHSLYRLVQAVGVDPKFGGFRAYSPNLTAEETPLDQAILRLYRYAGRKTSFTTFGQPAPYPAIEKDLKAAAGKLDPRVSAILGQLVLNVVDAHHWAELAFRNVPMEKRLAVARRLDLAVESTDAQEYIPEVDDVAAAWDEASLWYAGLKCVEALDTARRKLEKIEIPEGTEFLWETPLGWIQVTGPGTDYDFETDALLIVDLGGDDLYPVAVGASNATRPVSLCLDLGGNDHYFADRTAQGAGLTGVGILLDVAGDDAYEAKQFAQGVGQFGLGALIDLAGNDSYQLGFLGQGAGLFGIGLLIDAAGDDQRRIFGDGQGFGGVGGVGVLADAGGNDTYLAVPDHLTRPSYHSAGKVAVSNVQGAGMGRRGDGADGHSWAGGLGALLDAEGNDTYTSGNWSQGTGYWFGTGLLWDGGGDDRYSGVVWSQATGAHFCIGALIDESGNDSYTAKERNSIAFGHDFTIALLVDGGGNDRYETPNEGLGYSINRSLAALVDLGGDDFYRAKNVPGAARYDKRFADREALSSYWVEAYSLGLFLDLGGTDDYGATDRNGGTWSDPPESDNRKVRNVGVGMDVADGLIVWRPK